MVKEEKSDAIRRVEKTSAALDAMIKHHSRAVEDTHSGFKSYSNELEMAEKKMEGSGSGQLVCLRAKQIADGAHAAAKANAAAKGKAIVGGYAGAFSSAGLANDGAGNKIPVIDLTSDGSGESENKERGEVCLMNAQQNQGATRPKLFLPNMPLLPRMRSSLDVNLHDDVARTSQQVLGIKRKQPEEKREYRPFIPLLHETDYKLLYPRAAEEGSSSIPLAKEIKREPNTEEEKHETSIVPVKEKENEALIPLPEAGGGEDDESSSDPEEYDSLIPLAEDEEQGEHEPLVHLIGKNSSPGSLNLVRSKFESTLDKKRVKTIALSPLNDMLFVTSSLDGMVRLWELQPHRLRLDLLNASMDCLSPRKKRLPQDIAWHPNGNTLFGVHMADGQDSQVSIMNLSGGNGEMREMLVDFLEMKPHVNGLINSIAFLPTEEPNGVFVTGGSDSAVVVWRENDEHKWSAEALHRTNHTGAVMGVCGLKHKQVVLSVGMDRMIMGYDVATCEKNFMHVVDNKCLDVLPNPRDFNLFLVHTGTHKRQIRLFDIRVKHKEIHDLGWRQQGSLAHTSLIDPSWSSNGLFITCGSVDPQISIFDIRYKGHKPFFAVEGHQKRVYKAVCLQSLPLLISTSSDTFGLHEFA